jgi:UPF0755 protein
MNRKRKIFIFSFLFLLFLFFVFFVSIYIKFFKIKGSSELQSEEYLFISTGSNISDVAENLYKNGFISDTVSFLQLSNFINYDKNIHAGCYKIKFDKSIYQLVRLLKSGNQSPVKFTFNNIRFIEKFAGIIGNKLEIDSAEFMNKISDPRTLGKFGFDIDSRVCLFLPNTYEFYWNITMDEFLERMKKEYDKFWTQERKDKARLLGLSEKQVSILASIVQEETNKKEDMGKIAGVYLNRLHKNMLLQADPTARFAYGDFAVKRITFNYLRIDSPYNTYKYLGLPPGPICMTNPSTIDKVLNSEKHSFLYFCAKPDNSGYSAFATNLDEHNRNAAAYHRFLNKQGIH